jgi:hypothetical protein
MNLFKESNNKKKSLKTNNFSNTNEKNVFSEHSACELKSVDNNEMCDHKFYDNQNNFWRETIYNRKVSDLMEKICDESTTVCIIENGDITAMKMKTIICSYTWDREKNKFISQKNKGNKKAFKGSEDSQIGNHNDLQNQDDIEKCPIYRKNLIDLLDALMADSTTIGILQNGVIIAIKTKSIVINYQWCKNSKEFISQKVKNNKKKKTNKFDEIDNFDPEEVGLREFIN